MSDEKIIRMANQIASAFEAQGQEKAVAATAEHINKFWEKRMRAKLHLAFETQVDQLNATVIAARSKINR